MNVAGCYKGTSSGLTSDSEHLAFGFVDSPGSLHSSVRLTDFFSSAAARHTGDRGVKRSTQPVDPASV